MDVSDDNGCVESFPAECIVPGKGDKERIVCFDARIKLHLEKYLSTRTDKNPALSVSILHYAMVKQSNVKSAHRKYIG